MYKQYTEQYDRLWFLFCSKASGSATIGENEKKKNDNGNDKDNDEAKNHSNTRNTIYRYRRCTGPEMRVSHSRQPPRDRRRIGIGMGRGNRGWSSVLWIVVVWVLSAHNNTIPVDNNNNNNASHYPTSSCGILCLVVLPVGAFLAPAAVPTTFHRCRGKCIVCELRLGAVSRAAFQAPNTTTASSSSSSSSTASSTTVTTTTATATTTTTTTIATTVVPIPPPISDTTPCEVLEHFPGTDRKFFFPSPEDYAVFPKGDKGGYHIVAEYTVPQTVVVAFNAGTWTNGNRNRNGNGNGNASVPLQEALTALDPLHYPTLSRARKACRRGLILIRSREGRATGASNNTNNHNTSSTTTFRRGGVGDPVFAGDVLARQVFLGTYRKRACYPCVDYPRPQFELPVVYEDDHMAVVDKPAGVAVYSDTREGKRRTVHFCLPYVLKPPNTNTNKNANANTKDGLLRRPGIVHRLDKPTAGLLVVAKTRKAMESLKKQFENRRVRKLYTTIVNGDPVGCGDGTNGDFDIGVGVDANGKNNVDDDDDDDGWSLIDWPLGGKRAVTAWKVLRRVPSLNAQDGTLTTVRVRLHTGRYHQIRRHFAWYHGKPLVGDALYHSGMRGGSAHHFRKKGLFLCSDGIVLEHPSNGTMVEVTRPLPKRFHKLVNAEKAWAQQQQQQQHQGRGSSSP